MKLKENVYTCGTCKHYCYCYDDADNHCGITGEFCDEQDTCHLSPDGWTNPDEVEQTEDEQRANAGCDEAHRIMVEGREIG